MTETTTPIEILRIADVWSNPYTLRRYANGRVTLENNNRGVAASLDNLYRGAAQDAAAGLPLEQLAARGNHSIR